jgi:hypothetical protein
MFTFVQHKMLYSFRWYIIEEGNNELVFVNLMLTGNYCEKSTQDGLHICCFQEHGGSRFCIWAVTGFSCRGICLNPILFHYPLWWYTIHKILFRKISLSMRWTCNSWPLCFVMWLGLR